MNIVRLQPIPPNQRVRVLPLTCCVEFVKLTVQLADWPPVTFRLGALRPPGRRADPVTPTIFPRLNWITISGRLRGSDPLIGWPAVSEGPLPSLFADETPTIARTAATVAQIANSSLMDVRLSMRLPPGQIYAPGPRLGSKNRFGVERLRIGGLRSVATGVERLRLGGLRSVAIGLERRAETALTPASRPARRSPPRPRPPEPWRG